MEEVVGKLTTCTFSGPNWPYTLVWLYEGTHHASLPKEGHMGILPHSGTEASPCRLISQMEVCQLLIAGPQVIYPISLNGCNEPVISSLPEPLASSIILTASEPVYLEINIPPLLVEGPDQKVVPLGEVSTIIVASPHKSTSLNQKEHSMTMEVRSLLYQAVLEMSGCKFENLTPRRPNPVVVPTSPPQKMD